MASAGWKDWRDGERRMTSIAAEKNPENRISHSILTRRNPNPEAKPNPNPNGFDFLLFFLVLLKWERIEEREVRVAFMSASVEN